VEGRGWSREGEDLADAAGFVGAGAGGEEEEELSLVEWRAQDIRKWEDARWRGE
jgi:hypothetical protein